MPRVRRTHGRSDKRVQVSGSVSKGLARSLGKSLSEIRQEHEFAAGSGQTVRGLRAKRGGEGCCPQVCKSSVIVPIAFTSVCGAAVFFMLTFLRALLKQARRPRARFTSRHERTRVTPVSTGTVRR